MSVGVGEVTRHPGGSHVELDVLTHAWTDKTRSNTTQESNHTSTQETEISP